MLIGKFNHSIDIKNRISIPSKWRNELKDKIIITTGLDLALYLYSESEWDKVANALNSNNFLSADNRKIARYIYSNAYELSIDSHGRVLLPENLVKYANLTGEVILAGSYNRGEIWNVKTYEKNMDEISLQVNKIASKVLLGMNS